MAVALPAASLLAGGAAFVAGTGTVVAGSITLGQIAVGLSLASTAFSGISSAQQQSRAADAAELASQERAREVRLKGQREDTQFAIESARRERLLRRRLASQRAAFGSSGASLTSGSAQALQERTISEINRQQRLSKLQNDLRSSALNRQSMSIERAGAFKAASLRQSARVSLFETAAQVTGQIQDFDKTFSEGSE